jgi:glycosyltransferase involved in cell wall biosynthesis
MSRLAARTLQERYEVPASKISVVVPGANLLDDAVDAVEIQPSQSDDFVLGFVGLYPERKGLDRLAQAVKILRARRLPIRLRVIGACPDDIQSMDGIDFLGRIDKKTDFNRFIQAIGSVHLGCLVSRSELAGIALLEFLRLGVPVMGTRVGGIPDILEGGGSLLVNHDIAPEALADVIAGAYTNEARYQKLKQEAEARRQWASWKRVSEDLDAVLP